MNFFTLLFLCTPIDKTIQINFYRINFSFLCTPIDKVKIYLVFNLVFAASRGFGVKFYITHY